MITRQVPPDNRLRMRQTSWLNPTSHVQRVTLHDSTNREQYVEWAPGETQVVPSEYDNAIHRVDCGQEACHKGAGKKGQGWFCQRGHNGTVIGGLAPLLVRVGADDTLDPALDPDATEKRTLDADVAAKAVQVKAAHEALVLAAARAQTDKPDPDTKPAAKK